MKEEIIAVKIQTKDGSIWVSQSDYDQDTDNHMIVLNPVQVELVCELLRKAKTEIEAAE